MLLRLVSNGSAGSGIFGSTGKVSRSGSAHRNSQQERRNERVHLQGSRRRPSRFGFEKAERAFEGGGAFACFIREDQRFYSLQQGQRSPADRKIVFGGRV